MAVVRWEPVRELGTLQNEMNRLFSSFFDPPQGGVNGGGRRWVPAMDLVEREGRFVLKADLPGLDVGDVSIEVEDGVLTISGERREEHTQEGDGFIRVERATGAFRRSLTLPDGVEPEQIAATFAKGVLELTIPKPEERRPRRVAIEVGRSDGEGERRAPDIEGAESA